MKKIQPKSNSLVKFNHKPFITIKDTFLAILFFLKIPYMVGILQFFRVGYIVRVCQEFAKENASLPPPTNDLFKMLKDGLLASLIIFLFYLPFYLVFVLYNLLTKTHLDYANAANGFLVGILPHLKELQLANQGGYPFLIIVTLLYFIIEYLFPVAIIRYATSRKFGESFKIIPLIKQATSWRYFVVWVGYEILVELLPSFQFILNYFNIESQPMFEKIVIGSVFYFLVAVKDFILSVIFFAYSARVLSKKS